jgi:peptidoglycan hydrolase CwlO-like protein
MKRRLNIVVALVLSVLIISAAKTSIAAEPTDQLKVTIDSILVILKNPSLKGPRIKGQEEPS